MEKNTAIIQVLRKRFMALELHDYDLMKSIFYPKAQIIQSGRYQFQNNIEAYTQWLESLLEKIEFNNYQLKDIQVFETVAIVNESYHFHYIRKQDGVNCVGYGNASSVLKILDGRWQIIQTCISNHTLELESYSEVLH